LSPLDISNFGLSSADLNTVFDAGKIVGKVPSTLTEIIAHLDAIASTLVLNICTLESQIVQWIQEK
jgi:2-oxoglutarate dehydrogenase E1 component